MSEYRFVRLFLAIGPACAVLCALVFVAIGAWAVAQGIVGWGGVALFSIAGLIVAFLVMVLVDLTQLIADMLLPR